MKIININDIEELVLGKYEIEEYLLSIKQIDHKQSINDFIMSYFQNEYVYVDENDNMYSFSTYKNKKDTYIFISIDTDDPKYNEIISIIKRFDINTLHKLTYNEQLNENMLKNPKFIKDTDIYIEKNIYKKYK